MDYSDCYINIPDVERHFPVYRIITRERLKEIFEKQVNTLVKPHLWEDPFEDLLVKVEGQLPTGELVEFGQRYDFYGQCWTLRGNTDAMWRIYSGDKKSVRIKVRIRTLIQTFAPWAIGPVFIGKVRYSTQQNLLRWARTVLRDEDDPTINLLVRTLLVKRAAFSHEQEVRLLYLDPRENLETIFQYHIDPHKFIEEIVLDPRVPAAEVQQSMDEIRAVTGFRGPIKQSDLYAPPKTMVLHLGAAYEKFVKIAPSTTYEGKSGRKVLGINSHKQLILPPAELETSRK